MKQSSERNERARRPHRRRFVQTIAGCFGLTAAGCAAGRNPEPEPNAVSPLPLSAGQQADVGVRAEEIIERAYALGEHYEAEMKGCAQCTVAALQDAVDFVPADDGVFLASSCVDGGATPTGIANCGSFTGAGMVIGHVCGRSRENFAGHAKLSHKLIRRLYDRYREAYGSVLCKDIRTATGGQCPRVVGNGARWTAAILLEEFAGYTPDSAAAESGRIPTKPQESHS